MSNLSRDNSRLQSFLDNPTKALWTLAIPIMAAMGIQTIYTIVDMIFIGRLSGNAIAAVAFNMPLFFFVLGLTWGLGSGVTASIARFIGKKDKLNADNSAEHAVIMGFFISIFLTAAGLMYGKQMLVILGATEGIINLSWSYLRIICIGLPFMVFSTFFRSILAGEGDMKFPMMVAGLGTVLNIILDPIFIFTLKLGVPGAAMATVFSQLMVFLIFVYMLFIKEHAYIRFSMRDFRPSGFIFTDIIKVGLPASMSMIIMSIGQAVFNRILIFFSADTVAAYQVSGRIDMLIFLPIMAIGTSLTTLVGMFFGAQEMNKVKFIVKHGMSRAVLITLVSSVLVFTLAPFIVKIFSEKSDIQEIASTYLKLIALVYPLIAIGMTSGRVLQGLARGIPPLIITSIRVLGVSAPLASIFTFVLGKPLEWVWYSMMTSTLIAAILALGWVRHSFRQLSITK